MKSRDSQPPFYITLCYATLDEARHFANEVLEEVRLTMEEVDPHHGLNLPFIPENLGVDFLMDSPYEISLKIFPVIKGEPASERGEALAETLLTLDRDQYGGQPLWVQLRAVLEYVLSDVLPQIAHIDWSEVEDCFIEGTRPIILVDQLGSEIAGTEIDSSDTWPEADGY